MEDKIRLKSMISNILPKVPDIESALRKYWFGVTPVLLKHGANLKYC